jgi:voltage-gated potassium channel
MARRTIKRRIWGLLQTDTPGVSWSQILIALLIVASFVLFALETEAGLDPRLRRWAHDADALIPFIFAFEFLLRFWSSEASPRYAGLKGRRRFISRPIVVLDFLAFAPELFVMLFFPGVAAAAGWVRLLRVFRLLKLFAMFRAFREIAHAVRDAANQLSATFAVAGMLLFIAAAALYTLEGKVQPAAFGSIPRALWWAVATLTTVGYGDVYPITPAGKFVAGVVAIIGVGLVALPAGILANAFAERLRR